MHTIVLLGEYGGLAVTTFIHDRADQRLPRTLFFVIHQDDGVRNRPCCLVTMRNDDDSLCISEEVSVG